LLRKPAPDGRFYQWLWDYTWLLDRASDTPPKDDLTDWVMTFQGSGPANHALEMWRSHRESLPWLLAVLARTDVNSPSVPEVLSAADRIPANSRVYLTAFYHRMRLRGATHNDKEVRQSIDALLASKREIPSTAREDILDLRLDSASDLNDAAPFLGRNSNAVLHDGSSGTILAPAAVDFLSALPLDTLLDVLHTPALDSSVRKSIIRNVWIRAILLGRHDVATSLDSGIQDPSTFPGNPAPAQEKISGWVKQYESSSTPEEKQFAAIFLLQHQYAVGFVMGTQDSWCAGPFAPGYDAPARPAPPTVASSWTFLSEAQRKQAAAESTTLQSLDSQANFYVKVVLDFALAHPSDPRVPEALSRAVKNTRINCNNYRTGDLSKKAFDLLHDRYRNTPWAKNTKYWYAEGPY
jgi:hypothetical protein